MSTRTEQALATPELLEMILLLLSMKQLFRLQAVSQTFRDTIKSSKSLRRRMFLEYTEPEGTGVTNGAEGKQTSTPEDWPEHPDPPYDRARDQSLNPLATWSLLTHLSLGMGNDGYYPEDDAYNVRLEGDFTSDPNKAAQLRALLAEDAAVKPSWLSMLFTSLPMHVTIELKLRGEWCYCYHTSVLIDKARPCTLRNVLRYADAECRRIRGEHRGPLVGVQVGPDQPIAVAAVQMGRGNDTPSFSPESSEESASKGGNGESAREVEV